MYIGGVDAKGLHHLVWEIVDNSVDEYLNGHADAIVVTLHKNGDAVTVSDNGRGIPVDIHPKYHKTGVELMLTTLHAGGKFGDGEGYKYSGGLHGVGASVVNALSRKLVATIRRDGFEWQQTFKRGKPATDLEKVGPFRGHGTTIYFEPDPDIFKTTQFDPHLIRTHLEDMSYIHSGLKITFKNDATKEVVDLSHPGGIPEFLERLITEGQKATVTEAAFHLVRPDGDRMEAALQWTESTDETIRSYVNGIRTSSGGTHESGFKAGVVKAIRNFMATHEVKTKGLNITADDIREGLVGVLSVFVREPLFQGQTKERLNNPEMTNRRGRLAAAGPGVVAQRQQDGRRPDRRPDRAGRQGPAGVARGGVRRSSASRRRSGGSTCPASWPTARRPTWMKPSCSSSKATRPAARPSRAATTGRRPCCRCAARSSTPRAWP